MFYKKNNNNVIVKDYILITPAASFPITLQEAKDYLKISGSDQDAEITQLIATATDIGERITGRDFINKTYTGFLDCFPNDCVGLEIRKSKLQSITSIQYYLDDVLTVFNSSNYYTTQSNSYSSIYLNDSSNYPSTDTRKQAVEITFIAGYGAIAEDVPETLKKAILTHIAYLFENKGDCDGCGSDSVAKGIYRTYVLPSLFFRVV
jgi:uncharacterized phiE125 gp8 family phage protein